MPPPSHSLLPSGLCRKVKERTRPIDAFGDGFDGLISLLKDKKVVLLGEASHGTSEFYDARAEISRRLISEEGFGFVAVEGDWPPCYAVNRFVRHLPGSAKDETSVLATFTRWPTWMWSNRETADFVRWLWQYNGDFPREERAGFYGLDVYSLWESSDEIRGLLEKRDPKHLVAFVESMQCLEQYGPTAEAYARWTTVTGDSCEEEVIRMLEELRLRMPVWTADGEETRLQVEQNGEVIRNAEAYYRAMIRGGPESWNVRDFHMTDSLERLLGSQNGMTKGIVWAHNTHVGDARYTDMKGHGMVNLGQLCRQRFGEQEVGIVGFGTYSGTVMAGRAWGAPMENMVLPEATSGSWDDVFHQALGSSGWIPLGEKVPEELFEPRGQRAIGVVYHPARERFGNYVPTILPKRYDAYVHFDRTHALSPLGIKPSADREVPETYPHAL